MSVYYLEGAASKVALPDGRASDTIFQMTRRRFYAPHNAFTPDASSVTLSAEETRHLRNVLRLKSRAEVFVFDGNGREFRGEIENITRDSTTVRIIEEVTNISYESPLSLTIATGLLKGEKFDLIVQKLTELGVSRLVPVITARADVRLRSQADAARRLDRWRRIVLEATKQCGRTRLMTIEVPVALWPFLAQPRLPGEQRLLFAEQHGTSLEEATPDTPEAVTAVVGPEGGWAGEEIDQARAAGFRIVTLRGRTLRAETAAIVVAALLQHRFGDLR
jgi:16S rRNA (uracil1498-N3)-methyltransferase